MWLSLLAMVAFHSEEVRPLRPSDSELLEAVVAKHPSGRILSATFKDSPQGGGRIGCGLIDIDGLVEPFSTLTAWRDPPAATVRLLGQPAPPVQPPHWTISAIVPTHADADPDAETGRAARNHDALQRRLALKICPVLQAPEGSLWKTELEPHPDPARAAEARKQAKRVTDALFGEHD